MKKMKTSVLLLLFILLITKPFAQTETTEQLTVPLSNPGKAYSLKVHLVTGSIKITGYSGKDILVSINDDPSENLKNRSDEYNKIKINHFGESATLFKKRNNDMDSAANGMKKISTSGSYEVVAKENDNNVSISTSNPNKALNISLKIPQDVKIKVSTVNRGVEIENVKGELEVSNTNGFIKLTNISGSVVANTTNGNITTVFSSVDPKAPMAFTTFNGNVNVTLPADSKANLKLNSERGDVYSDFDINIDKTPSQVNTTKEPGMYKIKKDNAITGKINGGGAEISMKTWQGNIYVKKAVK